MCYYEWVMWGIEFCGPLWTKLGYYVTNAVKVFGAEPLRNSQPRLFPSTTITNCPWSWYQMFRRSSSYIKNFFVSIGYSSLSERRWKCLRAWNQNKTPHVADFLEILFSKDLWFPFLQNTGDQSLALDLSENKGNLPYLDAFPWRQTVRLD